MRVKMPATRIAQKEELEEAGEALDMSFDRLTCGNCQRDFVLSDIMKFIQHKIHVCRNKENYIWCDEGGGGESDEGSATLSVTSKPQSIITVVNRRNGEIPTLPPTQPAPLRTPNGGDAERKTSDVGTNTEHGHEPSSFTCCTCRQVYRSAWLLLQHVQVSHGLKIYLDPTAIPPSTSLDPNPFSFLRLPLGERSQFTPPIFPPPRPASSHEFGVSALLSDQFRLNPFPAPPFDRPPFVPPDSTPVISEAPKTDSSTDLFAQKIQQMSEATPSPSPPKKTTPPSTPFSDGGGATEGSADAQPSKPFRCDTCGKGFRSQSHLTIHQRGHTGDKNFACPLCDFETTQSSKLKRHMRVHSDREGSDMDEESQSTLQGSPEEDGDSSLTETEGEEEEEDGEGEEGEGDKAQDLSFKNKSPSPSKSPVSHPPLPPASQASTGSLVSELMSKYGLGNIQTYNEAYKAALRESTPKIPPPPPKLNPPPGPQKLENGADKRKADGRTNGVDKPFRLREDLPGNVFAPSFDALEAVKRLKMDYENSSNVEGRDLYAGLWLPAMGPPPYPLVPGPGSIPSLPPTSEMLKIPSSLDSKWNFNNSFNTSPQTPKDKRRKDACEYCGKIFKNCSNLTVHRRSHTGEKPYKCDLCSYACAQSSKLTRHMRTHGRMGKDVYRCRFCNMPFSVPSTLEKHMRKCVVTQTKKINLPNSSEKNQQALERERTKGVLEMEKMPIEPPEKKLASSLIPPPEADRKMPTLIPLLQSEAPGNFPRKILPMPGEMIPS